MIPRIKHIEATDNFKLIVKFDSGECVLYDVLEDINEIPAFSPLKTNPSMFYSFRLDESRTCVTWNDEIDLPSDTLLEYGKKQ